MQPVRDDIASLWKEALPTARRPAHSIQIGINDNVTVCPRKLVTGKAQRNGPSNLLSLTPSGRWEWLRSKIHSVCGIAARKVALTMAAYEKGGSRLLVEGSD